MARSGPSLLRNRNFILLFCAYGISAFGDHLSEAGLLQEMGIGEGQEKTRVGALMLFFFFLPYVLLGPLAGAVADRLPRRLIMIMADVFRGLIALGIPWFVIMVEDRSGWVMLMPILGLGLFACFFNPARLSFVPQVVDNAHLTQANSLLNSLAPIAAIASYLIGSWLAEISTTINFVGDGLTFFASAVLVACIIAPRRLPAIETPRRPIFRDIVAGFGYIRTHRRIWQLMIFTAAFWTAAGIFKSTLTTVVFDWYELGIREWGIFQATLGIGMMIGAVILTLVGDASKPHYNIVAALLGVSLMILLFSWTRNPWWAAPWAAGVGLFGVWILISANTLIQRIVPNHARGKVFGIIDLVNMTGMLLATGLLGDPFGILNWERLDTHVGGILGALAVVLALMGGLLWRHHFRRSPFGFVLASTKGFNELLCKFWYRLRRDGPCTVPRTGPCIITANHVTSADPNFLTAGSPYRLFGWMIAREFYNIPLCRHVIRLSECIPVRRDGKDIAATKQALRQLRAGKALGIFIEGRITVPHKQSQLRDGVAALALRSNAQVIPAHISGVKYHESVLLAYLLRYRVRIKYGRAVDLSEFTNPKDRDQVHAATQKIWSAIQSLAPEDGKVYLS